MNDSPRVDDNRVSADFVVGSSFISVQCRLTTRLRTPVNCESYNYNYPVSLLHPCPVSVPYKCQAILDLTLSDLSPTAWQVLGVVWCTVI